PGAQRGRPHGRRDLGRVRRADVPWRGWALAVVPARGTGHAGRLPSASGGGMGLVPLAPPAGGPVRAEPRAPGARLVRAGPRRRDARDPERGRPPSARGARGRSSGADAPRTPRRALPRPVRLLPDPLRRRSPSARGRTRRPGRPRRAAPVLPALRRPPTPGRGTARRTAPRRHARPA